MVGTPADSRSWRSLWWDCAGTAAVGEVEQPRRRVARRWSRALSARGGFEEGKAWLVRRSVLGGGGLGWRGGDGEGGETVADVDGAVGGEEGGSGAVALA